MSDFEVKRLNIFYFIFKFNCLHSDLLISYTQWGKKRYDRHKPYNINSPKKERTKLNEMIMT